MLDSLFTDFDLDLPGTENLAAGEVLSKDVTTGEYTWRVACCPRGHTGGNGEYISLFLQLPRRSRVARAIFEAFVMGKDGDAPSSLPKRSTQLYVSNDGTRAAGWVRFMKRSELEEEFHGGVVTIICGIIVTRDDAVAVPPPNLGDDLRCLLGSGDGSDVSFTVGGETFQAHRAVLAARSPVFRAELLGPMAEASMGSITLHDIEPAAFEALLHFMYTDALPPEPGDADGRERTAVFQQILAAADRYALDRLKLMCAQKLCDDHQSTRWRSLWVKPRCTTARS